MALKPSPVEEFSLDFIVNDADFSPAGITTVDGNSSISAWSDETPTVSDDDRSVFLSTVAVSSPPSISIEDGADTERAGPSSSVTVSFADTVPPDSPLVALQLHEAMNTDADRL